MGQSDVKSAARDEGWPAGTSMHSRRSVIGSALPWP